MLNRLIICGSIILISLSIQQQSPALGIYSGWLSTGGKISLKRENTHMFLEYRTARNLPIRREIATDWIYDPFFKYFYKYWTNHQNAVYWLILKILLDSSTYKLAGWAVRDAKQRNYILDWKNNLLLEDNVDDKRLKIKIGGNWEEYSVFDRGVSADEFKTLTYLFESPNDEWSSYILMEFFLWEKLGIRKDNSEYFPPKEYLDVSPLRTTIQLRHWEFTSSQPDTDNPEKDKDGKKWYQHAYVKYPLIGISLILILTILAQIGKLGVRRRREKS